MDVDQLLAPVSDEDAIGADLDGTPERYAIEEPFQLDSSEALPDGFDWRATIRDIAEQSKQTKDLWLAVYLARAGAQSGQLETVVDGVQMLAGLLERYWDGVHPRLEDVDFIGRKSPCESLTKIREFLGPLRRTTLISHARLGSYSGADIERFAVEAEQADGYGMFRAAVAETPVEDIQAAIDKLDQIRDGIRRSDVVLTENAGDDTGTNFQTTYDAIEAIRRSLIPYAGMPEQDAEEGEEAALDSAGVGAAGGPKIAGRVESRDDVLKALDAIGDYYRLKEPSSPVPVLLKRARNWVALDFLGIVADLVPDSMGEAKRVLVSKSDDPQTGGY